MTYALIIWTIVGFSGAKHSTAEQTWERKDWRVLTEHRSLESCEDAAKKLGYTSTATYRCMKL